MQTNWTRDFFQVPNEVGSLEPLRGYQGEDIEIQLPGNLTVYDIDWLAVWCVEYRHNFGHVYIPKDLDVPPALGQTKITVNIFHIEIRHFSIDGHPCATNNLNLLTKTNNPSSENSNTATVVVYSCKYDTMLSIRRSESD